jgi:SAM-dependent methyltransferase
MPLEAAEKACVRRREERNPVTQSATPDTPEARPPSSRLSRPALLFLASFLGLYFELVIVRYLSTEIRVFAYLKNLPLIASFFGLGLGMLSSQSSDKLRRLFPILTAVLFFAIILAPFIGLTHLPVPGGEYEMLGSLPQAPPGLRGILLVPVMVFVFFGVVSGIMNLVVMFFAVLGRIIGEQLACFEPLRGYGINLAGSLAGIFVITAFSFLGLPPTVWVTVGFLLAVPFFLRERWVLAAFAVIAVAMAVTQPWTFGPGRFTQNPPDALTVWSPYYRIDMNRVPPPAGWPRPRGYFISVNYDYHQKMLDLSPEFVARYPKEEPNRSALASYDLPYQLVPHAQRVLVVGAGTGNDVAAALRHGAAHVDAVEIDPYLVTLGRRYHPEQPYASTKVTVVVNDARAFFKTAQQKYDLIVFGYLDSHTLLSSLSTLRLDDYVYTLQSFREARNLLLPNGTLVLGFDSGRASFITDRLFNTLSHAFNHAPRAYYTGFDSAGVVFVEGAGAQASLAADYPEVHNEIESRWATALVATDSWPFLYLRSHTIPIAIPGVLILFLYFSIAQLRKHIPLQQLARPHLLHFFFLGAGFMLLETKGVTELSLLFGSTWIVNSVVIAAFLLMGFLANTLVSFRPVSLRVAYAGLFLVLIGGMFLRYTLLGSLPLAQRMIAGAILVGIPVFFSGLIFSQSFRAVPQAAQFLGVNLLGAVVGGILENLVMIGGTPILGVLSIVLYVLSAVFCARLHRARTITGEREVEPVPAG